MTPINRRSQSRRGVEISPKTLRPPVVLGGRSRLEFYLMGCQAPNVDKAPPRVRMAMVIRLVTDNMK